MSKKKGISKLKLNNIVKTLPTPIREHLKRCRKIADYFLKRVCAEDWFIETKYKVEDILSATYYHDIGKSCIPKDCLYLDHCATNSKKDKYFSHVEEGISLAEKESGITFDKFKENSLEHLVYCAILEHHENFDGSGYPNGNAGENISFVARLIAVIETFDNLLFVGNSNIDFEYAVNELMQRAGKQLDDNIVNILLKDKESLKDFVEYINEKEKDNRKKDRYGLQLRYRPLMNVRENIVDGFIADVVINDTYYGVIPSSSFVPIVEKSGQVALIQKIAFEKLCINLEKIALQGLKVPEVSFHVSARVMEKKNFFKDIDKLIKKYRVVRSKLNIIMSESSLIDFNANIVNAVNEVHGLGMKFVIGEFGDQVSLISTNDNIQIDAVIFKNMYGKVLAVNPRTYSIVSGMVRIAEKLNITVVLDGISDARAEESATKMHVKYTCGDRYLKAMTDAQLLEYLKTGGNNE